MNCRKCVGYNPSNHNLWSMSNDCFCTSRTKHWSNYFIFRGDKEFKFVSAKQYNMSHIWHRGTYSFNYYYCIVCMPDIWSYVLINPFALLMLVVVSYNMEHICRNSYLTLRIIISWLIMLRCIRNMIVAASFLKSKWNVGSIIRRLFSHNILHVFLL